MTRILVVDDEAHIREVVQYALEREGYQVETAANGAIALAHMATGGIDLVILDVLMPELDGLSLCRRLRAQGALPIIFLSSRTEEADRILGLDLGGDDYVTKPFSPRELAARVRSVLRRSAERASSSAPASLRHGRLHVDRGRHEVLIDDIHPVIVTVTEIRILAALLEHPGRVLTRAQLIEYAYDGEHHITERTIDTHVRNLRAKLAVHGVDAIETVHGLGYRCR